MSLNLLQYATAFESEDKFLMVGLNTGEVLQYHNTKVPTLKRPAIAKKVSSTAQTGLSNEQDKFQEKNGIYIIP